MRSNYIFAFLPYLRTREPIKYRDLTFRSIDDLHDLPVQALDDLAVLSGLFFLRDNYRIKEMTFAAQLIDGDDERKAFASLLDEFETLVAYSYASPRVESNDIFLTPEHATLYWFVPSAVTQYLIYEEWGVDCQEDILYPPPNDRHELPGFEVYRKGRLVNWIARGSRIYPPVSRITLNQSQDLFRDIGDRNRSPALIEYFDRVSRPIGLQDCQVLTAVDWYNQSNAEGVEESTAVLCLAVAFEALFDLPSGKAVTERFVDAVTLLLGRVPRLESWARQFYDARSDVAHKGTTDRLQFFAVDNHKASQSNSNSEYRPLIAYGRQIFRLSLHTIVVGRQIAASVGLSSQLVTNAERFARVLRTVNQDEEASTLIAAITDDVDMIERLRYHPEAGLTYNLLIKTAESVVQKFLETSPQDHIEVLAAMQDLVAAQSELDQLKAIRSIDKQFLAESNERRIRRTVRVLISSVWHYCWMYFYSLKNDSEERADPS